ncbi:hypothetical protein BJY59DRAFT_353035 [Rhodotorula toruloides]
MLLDRQSARFGVAKLSEKRSALRPLRRAHGAAWRRLNLFCGRATIAKWLSSGTSKNESVPHATPCTRSRRQGLIAEQKLLRRSESSAGAFEPISPAGKAEPLLVLASRSQFWAEGGAIEASKSRSTGVGPLAVWWGQRSSSLVVDTSLLALLRTRSAARRLLHPADDV